MAIALAVAGSSAAASSATTPGGITGPTGTVDSDVSSGPVNGDAATTSSAESSPAKRPRSKADKADGLPYFRTGIRNTYRYRGRDYVLPHTLVTIRGEVAAALDGQTVTITIKRGKRTVRRAHVKLKQRGGRSSYSLKFRTGKRGKFVVRTELTPEQKLLAHDASPVAINTVKTGIRRGNSSVAVRVFQSKLAALNYVTPRNGKFNAAMGRALMAYRKLTGMPRNESAGSSVARKLAAGKGAFKVRHRKAGRHIEVNIARQVMAFVDDGKVQRIYSVSTGKSSTPTIRGTYYVYRKDPGTNAKGMVKSSYFIRGYAIHGYVSVPPFAASHGCVRVPVPDSASIFAWVHMGTRVDTY